MAAEESRFAKGFGNIRQKNQGPATEIKTINQRWTAEGRQDDIPGERN